MDSNKNNLGENEKNPINQSIRMLLNHNKNCLEMLLMKSRSRPHSEVQTQQSNHEQAHCNSRGERNFSPCPGAQGGRPSALTY